MDDARQPLIEIAGVSKHFGEGEARVDALRDIGLTVRRGEVVALLGPSGSGKTTLLNVIGCIIAPTVGRVTLDGELVYDNRALRGDLRRLRLDKIGFIFQFHNLLPFLNARDNVALVLTLAGRSSAEAQAQAVELLDYLEVGHRKDTMPALLSGGEAQRVAIARAREQSAHHPCGRAYGGAGQQTRGDRDGSSAQTGCRTGCLHCRRHPCRKDLRPLRPFVSSARWGSGSSRRGSDVKNRAYKSWPIRTATGVAILFGLLTILSGGRVLFGDDTARAAAGNVVWFVLWFNFLSGFAYVLAGVGIATRRRWAASLSILLAISIAVAFLFFGFRILSGEAFEMRTMGAMTLRLVVWVAIAMVSRRSTFSNQQTAE